MNTRDMLPSERAAAEAEQAAKAKNILETRQSMMREDFTKTFQTEHGKRVLAWLFERCGYDKSKLGATTQGVLDGNLTIHNAMEETLYIAIRKFISIDVLQQIEYGQVKPSGTIEQPKKPKARKKK